MGTETGKQNSIFSFARKFLFTCGQINRKKSVFFCLHYCVGEEQENKNILSMSSHAMSHPSDQLSERSHVSMTALRML